MVACNLFRGNRWRTDLEFGVLMCYTSPKLPPVAGFETAGIISLPAIEAFDSRKYRSWYYVAVPSTMIHALRQLGKRNQGSVEITPFKLLYWLPNTQPLSAVGAR